jgi:hypothetical protein
MPSLHDRYDNDERRLVATAAAELWTDALINDVVDAAAEILEGASWHETPKASPPRWRERSTAILALGAMALRSTRTAALTIRAGYGPEALADLRRLIEAAGHAQCVLDDTSGQYAENWLRRRGKAGKPRIAFGPDSADDLIWKLMSDQSHADFASYANHSAMLNESPSDHPPHRPMS